MDIFEADVAYRELLEDFYLKLGYPNGCSDLERVFVAIDQDEIIGAVKVETHHDFSVLRGMFITDSYQRQGLGTDLIKYIEPILNKTVSYCIPAPHLTEFYGQIGFKLTSPDTFPTFLKKRFLGYKELGYPIVAMWRQPII